MALKARYEQRCRVGAREGMLTCAMHDEQEELCQLERSRERAEERLRPAVESGELPPFKGYAP